MVDLKKVRYIGSSHLLRGATALTDGRFFQLDRYPSGPPVEDCNPTIDPLMFTWTPLNDEWEPYDAC